MIVYGDPQFSERADVLVARLRGRLRKTRCDSLEQLRTLLIQTGQFEQALADAFEESATRRKIQPLTDLAAAAFYHVWSKVNGENPPTLSAKAALDLFRRELDQLPFSNRTVMVKVPEGFEFYTLFPEQYCAATLAWMRQCVGSQERGVLVVGVRSIGTTLSAIVARVLEAHGWFVARTTVRPSGHPYARRVSLSSDEMKMADAVIIVDEGPGLSGSSIVAVAEALAEAGVVKSRIAFFPGNDSEPGSAASEEIRRWWRAAERHFVPVSQLRWGTESIEGGLLARTEKIWNEAESFGRLENLSAGRWREKVFQSERDWPPACSSFERSKFLCTSSSSARVLWKFIGLGAWLPGENTSYELALETAARRGNCIPQPFDFFRGFMAMPWIHGRRLGPANATSEIVGHIGRYIVNASGPPLEESEQQQSHARLAEMLFWNTKEKLGDVAGENAKRLGELAGFSNALPGYGDGRMAPWKFVLAESGNILKTDWFGHDVDHTMIGRQSLLWDVAGTIVEWNLNEALVRELLQQTVPAAHQTAVSFYRAAYSAFRMGQSAMGAAVADRREKVRLEVAQKFYCRHLATILQWDSA